MRQSQTGLEYNVSPKGTKQKVGAHVSGKGESQEYSVGANLIALGPKEKHRKTWRISGAFAQGTHKAPETCAEFGSALEARMWSPGVLEWFGNRIVNHSG